MNEFQLQIRGYDDGQNIERFRPVFVWKAPSRFKQFTLEMARDAEFKHTVFLRDTRENYYAYDSAELKANTTYYIRVRSGIGPWSVTRFITEN